MKAHKRLMASLRASDIAKRADEILRAIPTEYAGNLVTMSVTAHLSDGRRVRNWCHEHYAHGWRGWSEGLTAEQAAATGLTVTVRSSGSDALGSNGRSWDWTKTI